MQQNRAGTAQSLPARAVRTEWTSPLLFGRLSLVHEGGFINRALCKDEDSVLKILHTLFYSPGSRQHAKSVVPVNSLNPA